MNTTLVFNFSCADQPGRVETLSDTVKTSGGNWLESSMTALAGQFAGIVRVAVDEANSGNLRSALQALEDRGFTIRLSDSSPVSTDESREQSLSLVGNDRPGLLRELSRALSAHGINVLELDTAVTSAAMSGDPLFEAKARIAVPASLNEASLLDELDSLAEQLEVDVKLD